MTEVRRCPEHGFHEGVQCPVCASTGEPILDGDRRRRLSKFLSGALRHFPGDAGIELDDRGWTDRESLIDAAERQYGWADETSVAAVIATDPKGRFEVHRGAVRAAYGHSVGVELESTDGLVPDVLFHGTAPDAAASILTEGIRPMNRQLVHLSGSVDEALDVGARHADEPTLLEIDAAAMLADGRRVTKRGRSVYTTEFVPPEYVARCD